MSINENGGFILSLCLQALIHIKYHLGFFPIVQYRDNFTYFVLGVFEQQRRRERDWEFHETEQMSRHREEGNHGTGAPLTVWDGRSGKELFQYIINNQ